MDIVIRPLSLDEVADEINLSATTRRERRRQVRELVAAGDLRVINPRLDPRRWRISRWEVLRYNGHPDYTDHVKAGAA